MRKCWLQRALCLVKHLAHAGRTPGDAFEMLLVEKEGQRAWHISTPLLPFTRPPVGVGDLTSACEVVPRARADVAPHLFWLQCTPASELAFLQN